MKKNSCEKKHIDENEKKLNQNISSSENAFNKFKDNKYVKEFLKDDFALKYNFFGSIAIFITMFFVVLFYNAKIGYKLNDLYFDRNNSFFIAGTFFIVLCFFTYIPIGFFTVKKYVFLFLKKKKVPLFNFVLETLIQVFNLYLILSTIIYAIVNYKLFFITEIIGVFIVIVFAYFYLQNKNIFQLEILKKMNEKEIHLLDNKKAILDK